MKELFLRLLWGDLQERKKRGLVRLHDLLARTSFDGKYWITMGLLLGYMRDGGPIPWDRDFDFGFMEEDLAHFLSAVDQMRAHGYDLRPTQINNDGRTTKWALKYRGVKYEFFQFERRGEKLRWFYHRRKPPMELTNEVPSGGLAPLDMFGRRWLRPDNAEEILTAVYGDWRTPNPEYHYSRDCVATIERRPWTGKRGHAD